MDFVSHILIGLTIGKIFSIERMDIFLLTLGSILPDLSVLPLYIYYGGAKAKENFFNDKREKPFYRILLYDFAHSLLLVLIIGITSYIFYKPLFFLGLGILVHILIDIPLHKKHSPGIFFPFDYRIRGSIDWPKIYYSFKTRIIVWSLLIIIYIALFIIKTR